MALFWATALIFNVFWLLVAADVWAFRLPQTLLLSHYRGQSNNLPPLGWNTQTTSGQLHTLTRKQTGTDTHIDTHRVALLCTHPEIPPHPNDTHARTYTHTQFWTKTISIQFSVSNALPFTSHQLAMLCVSVCPDLLKWNWTLWGKLCQACPSDLSHSFSWT